MVTPPPVFVQGGDPAAGVGGQDARLLWDPSLTLRGLNVTTLEVPTPFTVDTSTVSLADLFGLHMEVYPGHAYGFYIAADVSANSLSSGAIAFGLTPDQGSKFPFIAEQGEFISSAPTGKSFDFMGGYWWYQLDAQFNATTFPTVTTTDWYLTVYVLSALGAGESIVFSSVSAFVVDMGLYTGVI